MSKSISLVLISSSLILGGCTGPAGRPAEITNEDSDPDWGSSGADWDDAGTTDGSGSYARHGTSGHGSYWYFGRRPWWGYGSSPGRVTSGGGRTTTGGRPSTGGSVRSGGFGSTGHAVGS